MAEPNPSPVGDVPPVFQAHQQVASSTPTRGASSLSNTAQRACAGEGRHPLWQWRGSAIHRQSTRQNLEIDLTIEGGGGKGNAGQIHDATAEQRDRLSAR